MTVAATAVSDTPDSEVLASEVPTSEAPESEGSSTTMVAMTPKARPREPMPTAVIAMRFPGEWQGQAPAPGASNGDNDPPQTMAYATEPAQPAASSSSFELASAESHPEPVPMPKRMPKPAPAKNPVLFNDAQLASIKARLKLSPDQEQYWPQVEQALRAISWKLATSQSARRTVRGGQAAMIDPNSPEVAHLKSAAFPLIMSMRADQKQEVRQLAHTMGLTQVASMF